jgi:hypothetical protein
VKARDELGRTLEHQVREVHDVELLAFVVNRALDVELDLRDLSRGQMLKLRGQRVQLDAADGSNHPHAFIAAHGAIIRGLH